MVIRTIRTPDGFLNVDLPDVPAGGALVGVEAPVAALSKLGGPGAADVVIGSVDIPAIRLTTDTQFLSTRIVAPPGWETTRNVIMNLGLAINAGDVPADGETLTLDFNYIYARSGAAAIADLGKAATALAPVLTFTTAEGLAAETLYNLSFALDRADVTNPYQGQSTGGFGFEFNIDAASVIGSIDVVAAVITYPVSF